MWLIQNAPECDILATPFGLLYAKVNADAYTAGKEVWIDQLENNPENLSVLENAAKYFMLSDPDLANEALIKAQSLDQENPKWSAALGELYSLNTNTKTVKDKHSEAIKALEELENAYNHSTGLDQAALLEQLAKAALIAENTEKAKTYAELMLSQSDSEWNCENHIHHGNITLGKLALATGDVETAKQRLLKAAESSGSPNLNSFGPDMNLAKELLQKGEKDAVLKYLALCSQFWGSGKDRLDQWTKSIDREEMPSDWG
ncbi:hypothetical protein Pan241w_54410 [Gimesia alba]|uniref:Tetratricopeptide repeat protein n=1 Tax=Gimesia alba TaxID=2527973 RepID=A0A517RN66_9PLAN|nr:RNA polymerase subunit sigma-24 [Gimesia alba]QDT45321.1 hypothetical protein Pan241w_54410 [Gimesia alba]